MFPVIVVIGALIGLAGMLVYMKNTLVGGTKPNRVSWLIWCVAPLTAFAASWEAGVRWAALPTFVAGFGPLLVICASFANKNAYWKLERLDYGCGVCSFLALALWAVTSDPLVAIVLSCLTGGLAAVPTIIKEWRSPETESIYAYIGGLVSGLSAFTAITVWKPTSVAYPSYMVLISVLLVAPLLRRRKPKLDANQGPKDQVTPNTPVFARARRTEGEREAGRVSQEPCARRSCPVRSVSSPPPSAQRWPIHLLRSTDCRRLV